MCWRFFPRRDGVVDHEIPQGDFFYSWRLGGRWIHFFIFRDCQGLIRGHNHPPTQPSNQLHPMSDKSIEERVKDIIVDQLGVNADQVNLEAKFVEDLGADSLDTVELVMAFEEEFEIEVPDEEAEKLTSVGDVVAYITSQQG